jgi:alkaline phosphatase D
VAAAKPDLFLFVGDAIYGDWHGDQPFVPTPKSLQADWERLAAIPEFAAVREQVPFMAIWDNHDYGSHDGGADFALKETSKSLFLHFFGEPEGSQRRATPGIYYARVIGPEGRQVQIILLDTKSFRSEFRRDPRTPEERKATGKVGKYLPRTEPTATLLGEAQWEWLAQQLEQPAELRLVVSSTQVVADEKGMDEWGVFPRERQRLFDLIDSTGAEGVLLLSGNVHFTEVSRFDGNAYPLYDFTASGMTHVNPDYAAARSDYRVAGPFVEHNIGLVEIDWDTEPAPVIRLAALGVDSVRGLDYEISLGDLR